MPTILLLVPNLEHQPGFEQAALLAGGLCQRGHQVEIISLLGSTSGDSGDFQNNPFPVHCLGQKRLWDLHIYLGLRNHLLRLRPSMIHLWGLDCLRAMALLGPKFRFPIVYSPNRYDPQPRGWLAPVDRWLLQKTDYLVASNYQEAGKYFAEIAGPQLVTISPTCTSISTTYGQNLIGENPGGSSTYPAIVCTGKLEKESGFYHAIWSFDVLRHGYPELRLRIFGEGPSRPRLEKFLTSMEMNDVVYLQGTSAEEERFMASAFAVWVTSTGAQGRQAVMKAMVHGCPVVAVEGQGIEDLVVHGETGYIVQGLNKVAFGKHSRRLIEEPTLRQEMGNRARERFASLFSQETFIERHEKIYQDLVA